MSDELTDDEKKLLEGVAMPGDGDEPADKQKAELKVQRGRRASKREASEASNEDGKADESLVRADTEAKQHGSERGPHSVAQADDDGWGDTPVQMRGPVEPPEDEVNAPLPGSPVEPVESEEPSSDSSGDKPSDSDEK